MSNKSILKTIGFLVFATFLVETLPAYAAYTRVGFQWVTPSDAPVVPNAPLPYAPPPSHGNANNAPEIISPVIIEGKPNVAAGVSSAPSAPTDKVSVPPTVNGARTVTIQSQGNILPPQEPVAGSELISASSSSVRSTTTTTVPPLLSSSDVVQGFAKQVPLAVALRQLLPPGYGFSVDQNVDLGTLVSFQGGQPWRETMRAALDPVGLVMREQGQMVTIMKGDQAPIFIEGKGKASDMDTKIVETPSVHGLGTTVGGGDTVTTPAGEMSAGPIVQSWSAERGDTLHKILEDWSQHAKVEFDWLSEYDYPLQASVSFSGTFEDAVRNLLFGFEGAHPQPVAELHANSNLGQMVLVVTTRGNNYSN